LKQMGIKLNQEEKGKIINGNHDLVFRVISKLREIYQRSAKESKRLFI
jgi:predicted phosphohydrolase